MPLRSWILFITVMLTLLGVIHGFILFHLWPLFGDSVTRWILLGSFIFLGLSYIAGRALESTAPKLSLPLLHLGSWWLGCMSYLFLGCFVLDLIFLLNCFLPVMPADIAPWMLQYFLVLSSIILIALVVGHLNVRFPKVRHLSIPAPAGLRIVIASDIHLCGLVSSVRIQRIVRLINEQAPDLILLPGDTIDEDLTKSPRSDPFRAALQQLQSTHGVIAVTGNHEWISGVDATSKWLESCGIKVLRDQAINLGPVIVAGREDAASVRVNQQASVPLKHILQDIQRDKPLIVLDHQPVRIQEAVDVKADLLFCGHTHHGQFWPFQWITQRIFQISHGHQRRDGTDIYVSCGTGAWGPQIRTSSRSEIVVIG